MATLEIRAARQFNHVADLTGYMVQNNDPRSDAFDWNSVRVDLSRCDFIHPIAALWCVIYSLLAANRGAPCKVETPTNPDVRSYLNRLGLFETLESAGVEVDRLEAPNPNECRAMLPLTQLTSFSQVEELSNAISDNLSQSNLSSANVYDDVHTAFGELANNAIEHSESQIGAYGFVQFTVFEGQPRFICAVADGGIGIRASLAKNPDHNGSTGNDIQAIAYALEENISVHGNTRGLGFAQIIEFILPGGRELILSSGYGFLRLDDTIGIPNPISANLFPGTVAFMSIPA